MSEPGKEQFIDMGQRAWDKLDESNPDGEPLFRYVTTSGKTLTCTQQVINSVYIQQVCEGRE